MKVPELARRITQMLEDYSGWHWVNDDPYRPLEPPGAQQLHRIQAQTLILVGELNPTCILIACDFLQEKIKNSKKIQIPKVAHMLHMEDPEQFNIEILKFLESI